MSNDHQHISVRNDQDILIVTIELKTITEYELARTMEKELVGAASKEESDKVVVDMGKLEFMSSVAYMPFISLRSLVRKNGGRIVLCNLSDVIKDAFEATRLLINPQSPKSMFEYTDSLDNAVKLLR